MSRTPLLRRSYVVLELPAPISTEVHEVRSRFSPLRAMYPSEITIAGSGGVGPICTGHPEEAVFAALDEIAASTPPFVVTLGDVRGSRARASSTSRRRTQRPLSH